MNLQYAEGVGRIFSKQARVLQIQWISSVETFTLKKTTLKMHRAFSLYLDFKNEEEDVSASVLLL